MRACQPTTGSVRFKAPGARRTGCGNRKGDAVKAVRFAVLVGALSGALAVGATYAVANPLQWWVKPASGPWAVLPLGAPETLAVSGSVAFFEAGGKNAKCTLTGQEQIENPLSGGPGVDQIEAFVAKCSVSPVGLYPCSPAEQLEVRGLSFNWPSLLELVGSKKEDRFSGAVLEFECQTSHAVSTATEFTPLRPKVAVDKLRFAGVGSGELESGPHKIWIKGVGTLVPALYMKVKANT